MKPAMREQPLGGSRTGYATRKAKKPRFAGAFNLQTEITYFFFAMLSATPAAIGTLKVSCL
jgi:hypothetical protein